MCGSDWWEADLFIMIRFLEPVEKKNIQRLYYVLIPDIPNMMHYSTYTEMFQ